MRQRWRWAGILTVALLSTTATVTWSVAEEDPWAPGKQWLSLRSGYAKSWVEGAGHGGFGYGFGFSRMLSKMKIYRWTLFKQFSLGGYVHHETLGRLGGAAQIEVPATLELVRHLKWKTPLRPYLGVGGGPFYRKTYRTGDDIRNVEIGYYLALGANTPVSEGHLLGVDLRFIRVDESNVPANPVFGLGSAELTNQGTIKRGNGTHWSVKLSYSLSQ